MRHAVVVLVLCIASAAAAEGFRDIEWGETLSVRNDFRIVRDGIESEYRRMPENLSGPGGKASDIAYRCYKNRFYEAEVMNIASGDERITPFEAAKNDIDRDYGPGECPPAVSDVRVCLWRGSATTVELYGGSDRANVSFYSTEIASERASDNAKP